MIVFVKGSMHASIKQICLILILSIFGLILPLFFVFDRKAYFVLSLQKLGAHFEIQDIRLYD